MGRKAQSASEKARTEFTDIVMSSVFKSRIQVLANDIEDELLDGEEFGLVAVRDTCNLMLALQFEAKYATGTEHLRQLEEKLRAELEKSNQSSMDWKESKWTG